MPQIEAPALSKVGALLLCLHLQATARSQKYLRRQAVTSRLLRSRESQRLTRQLLPEYVE